MTFGGWCLIKPLEYVNLGLTAGIPFDELVYRSWCEETAVVTFLGGNGFNYEPAPEPPFPYPLVHKMRRGPRA